MSLIERLSKIAFLRFSAVGAAGYIVDNAVLFFMTQVAGSDEYSGRIVSVMIAMTFTWLGNRLLTFSSTRAHGAKNIALEGLRFAGTNAVGAVINFGSYAVLVTYATPPWNNPFVALPVGVMAGMIFNFLLSKHFVFGRRTA